MEGIDKGVGDKGEGIGMDLPLGLIGMWGRG